MEPQTTKKRSLRIVTAVLVLTLAIFAGLFVLYWHGEGRLVLRGRVQPNITVIPASTGGRISAVAVAAGDVVTRGQVLVRLDEEVRRKALVGAREQLNLLAQMLPPQYRPAPDSEHGGESLDQMHRRRQREEEMAMRRLQEASDREAEASVSYSRIAMLAARSEATGAERDAVAAYLAEVRQEKERARQEFEALSLARAASGADIRRVRDAQRASGTSGIPVDARLNNYRLQEERVSIAMRALEQSLLLSPADGVVAEVLVKPGQEVGPGTPLVLLRQDGATLFVLAPASADERKKLKRGMRCLVRVEGENTDFEGYVSDLRPEETGEGAAMFRVALSLLPWATPLPGAMHAVDAAGLDAAVTILLREPIYMAELGGDGQTGKDVSEPTLTPPAEGAPPAAPLSVQSPSGHDASPRNGGGAPSETPWRDTSGQGAPKPDTAGTGRGAPVLRPMEAPYPLKGSPFPDPDNNPSVVTEETLDNAAKAAR